VGIRRYSAVCVGELLVGRRRKLSQQMALSEGPELASDGTDFVPSGRPVEGVGGGRSWPESEVNGCPLLGRLSGVKLTSCAHFEFSRS